MGYIYQERKEIEEVSCSNTIYFWDNSIDIFQENEVGDTEIKTNISFDKDSAIRYANMIIKFYKDSPT